MVIEGHGHWADLSQALGCGGEITEEHLKSIEQARVKREATSPSWKFPDLL